MNHEYKNEVQSEVTAILIISKTFYDFKAQESALTVLAQDMQHAPVHMQYGPQHTWAGSVRHSHLYGYGLYRYGLCSYGRLHPR